MLLCSNPVVLHILYLNKSTVPSKQNAVADVLSRLPLPSTPNDEDSARVTDPVLTHTHKEISHATRADSVLSNLLEYVAHGWPKRVEDLRPQPYFNRRFQLSVEQGCLLGGLRVVIPTRYQEDMLQELHSSHPGIVRMKELARSYL